MSRAAITPEDALAQLRAQADPDRAAKRRAYLKTDRLCLGLTNVTVNELAATWRKAPPLDQRIALARGLWESGIFEARIAAAKLFVQARIRPDDTEVWALIKSWMPDLDNWAIADAVAQAAHRRLAAVPARLDDLEPWTQSDHLWTKRAALVFALPWTKQRHPKPAEIAARRRILGWCANLAQDGEWFIQKAVAWWLRELSKRDPQAVAEFLEGPGKALKPWAVREAGKYIP